MNSIIEIQNLTHAYGGRLVFDDINLKINEGEFITIVGPSGCGKSTLLKLIVGSEKPTQGTIKICGEIKNKPDRHCGIVYQKYSLFPHLTALENVAIGLNLDGNKAMKNVPKYREQARAYLEKVGLKDAAHLYATELSGGMEQRVAIAQALIMKPKILLLDEPFSALDPWNKEQLEALLIQLYRQENITVIFVTHHLEEAVYLGTRVIVFGGNAPEGFKADTPLNKIIADFSIYQAHPRPADFKNSLLFKQTLDLIKCNGSSKQI